MNIIDLLEQSQRNPGEVPQHSRSTAGANLEESWSRTGVFMVMNDGFSLLILIWHAFSLIIKVSCYRSYTEFIP